jgi:predicted ester cyclase
MKKLLLVLVILLAVPRFALASSGSSEDASTLARNKAVAARMFEEIFNQGKFDVADEIYMPDFVGHGLHGTWDLREDRAAQRAEKAACPDLKMSIDMMVAEGDLVTVVWTFRGTQTGWWGGYEGGWWRGLPPTGARIELRGMTVWRFVDGRIREEWGAFSSYAPYVQVMGQLKWRILALLGALAWLSWGVRRWRRRRRARKSAAMSAPPICAATPHEHAVV